MKSIIAAFAIVGLASAHNTVVNFHINGTPNSDCVRQATSVNPIFDVSSDTMACNTVKGNGKTKCVVKGGDSIAFEWRADPGIPAAQYPLKDGTIPVGVTDDSHKGPCTIYMKKVDDALTATGPGDGWFKVAEDGLDSSGTFCTDRLRLANAPQPGVVPKNIPAGDYLFRAEILTLNDAGPASLGGAEQPQFYVSCVQVTVEGTSGNPDVEKVSIPGYLTLSPPSPGLIFDIWNSKTGTFSNYPIPGPKPLTDNAGSSPAASSPAPTASSSSVPVQTSTPAVPKTPSQDSTGDGDNGGSVPTTTPSSSKPASATKTVEPTTFSTKTTTTIPESETDVSPESDSPSASPSTGRGCHGRRHRCRQYEPKAYGNWGEDRD